MQLQYLEPRSALTLMCILKCDTHYTAQRAWDYTSQRNVCQLFQSIVNRFFDGIKSLGLYMFFFHLTWMLSAGYLIFHLAKLSVSLCASDVKGRLCTLSLWKWALYNGGYWNSMLPHRLFSPRHMGNQVRRTTSFMAGIHGSRWICWDVFLPPYGTSFQT